VLQLSNAKPEQMKAVKGIVEHDVLIVLPAGYRKSVCFQSLLLVYESDTPGFVGRYAASSQLIHHTSDVAHSVGNILRICRCCNVCSLRLILAYVVMMT